MEKSNRIEKFIRDAVQWIRLNRERFWTVTGVVFSVVAIVILVIHHRQNANESAWTELGAVEGLVLQNQIENASKALVQWNQRYAQTQAAPYAKFFAADLAYRTTDYARASSLYGELSESAQPVVLRPLALHAQIACEEMAGHLDKALSLAQLFQQRYPDHFFSAPVLMGQARLLEAAGTPAAAKDLYQRVALLYPQSPWAGLAQNRVQQMAGKVISPK